MQIAKHCEHGNRNIDSRKDADRIRSNSDCEHRTRFLGAFLAVHSPIRGSLSSWRNAGIGFAIAAASAICVAQKSAEYHKSLPVSNAEPVVLSVEMRHGDVEVLYNRDGQVSISAVGQVAGDSSLDDSFFPTTLAIQQSGNHVSLRQISNMTYSEEKIRVRLRIDVPYRTEVSSIVGEGKQTIRGVLGPVQARADKGDIKASYVSKTLRAATGKEMWNFR
jgi:hypothetical protein